MKIILLVSLCFTFVMTQNGWGRGNFVQWNLKPKTVETSNKKLEQATTTQRVRNPFGSWTLKPKIVESSSKKPEQATTTQRVHNPFGSWTLKPKIVESSSKKPEQATTTQRVNNPFGSWTLKPKIVESSSKKPEQATTTQRVRNPFGSWNLKPKQAQTTTPKTITTKSIAPSDDLKNDGHLIFASKLARIVGSVSKDSVISPDNLKSALYILKDGISPDSECGKKFNKFLNGGYSKDDTLANSEFIEKYKTYSKNGLEMQIVNRFLIKKGNDITPTFNQSLKKHHAKVGRLNFKNVVNERRRINKLVSKDTNGLIPEILADGQLTPDTELLSINSLYLKSLWKEPFDKNDTAIEPFMREDGQSVDISYMKDKINLLSNYDDSLKAQVFVLNYSNPDFQFIIVKPYDNSNLKEVENIIFSNPKLLSTTINNAEEEEVILYMPKIKNDYEINLEELLKSEGLSCIFEKNIDNMVVNKKLAVGGILQKTKFEADEDGSKGVSTTVVKYVNKIGLRKVEINKPFLYIVWHVETQKIMFWGRVANPPASK